MMQKKLYRSRANKMALGVCSGIAEYFNIDPTIVRVAWAVTSIFFFPAIIAYFVCAFVIPEKPDNEIIDAQ